MLEAERTSVKRLSDQVVAAVEAEVPELVEDWRAQSLRVAPGEHGEAASAEGHAAVRALVRGVAGEGCWQDDLVRIGWSLGVEEFRRGASLHGVIRQVDLLEAMVLYAVETASARDEGATAADGIALARRLQRARSLLLLAVVKSFIEAYLASLRGRYRALRHDLRNPLGTIRTAVSLMEDETIPAELRASPRFRTMVKRNATAIDALIGRRLADDTTCEGAFAWHDVALADLVRTVRRELREEASDAHCEIVPDPALPVVRTDALGAELLLRTVIGAVLRVAAPHGEIRVVPGPQPAAVEIRFVAGTAAHEPYEAGIALAGELAAQLGGRVAASPGSVLVELPGSERDELQDFAGASQRAD